MMVCVSSFYKERNIIRCSTYSHEGQVHHNKKHCSSSVLVFAVGNGGKRQDEFPQVLTARVGYRTGPETWVRGIMLRRVKRLI